MSSELPVHGSTLRAGMADLASSIPKGVPMLSVADIAATLDWYASIGFEEIGRYEDDGVVNWGMLSFGKAEIMLRLGDPRGAHDLSLWLYTDKVDDLYRLLRPRQLDTAQAAPLDEPDAPRIAFVEDLYDPFYGGRQFSIRDLNGYTLIFLQPSR
jgi:catechol 2,3-dioxygenase-like lactoylglutathione lyase family enzyme